MTPTKAGAFSSEFLARMKQSLEEEKERLTKELSGVAKKDPNATDDYNAVFPEYGDEEGDNASEVAQYTTNKSLEVSFEKMLSDVNKALERVDKGTYGICKYCDRPIDEKRLEARPTSSACISCKKTLTDEI